VVLGAVTAYPVLWVLWLSLQRRVPVFDVAAFVGLRHYAFLLTDGAFWNAVRVTALFTAVSVALEIGLGIALALALHHQRRGRALALALLLLPWCLPGVVTARTFEWIYYPTGWLGDPARALPALIAADVWRTTPFVALLALARRGSIPLAVYEAAAVDGAGRLAIFRAITLPLLAPVLVTVTLFRVLDALRAFDLMFVLTGGGPARATETLTIYAYRNLFQTLQLGFGSAVAVVVFLLVVAVAAGQLRLTARWESRA
jgi:multiple sugar transport system permease protein